MPRAGFVAEGSEAQLDDVAHGRRERPESRHLDASTDQMSGRRLEAGRGARGPSSPPGIR